MDSNEAAKFWKELRALWPGLAKHFGGSGDAAALASELIEDSLEDVAFDEAREVARRWFRGDWAKPKGFSEYPAAIRRDCRRLRSERSGGDRGQSYVGGEKVVDCPLCLDSGIVVVWSVLSMRAMRDGEFGPPKTRRSTAVACSCSAGDKPAADTVSGSYRFPGLPRYRPSCMVLCDGVTSEEAETALREFFENRQTSKTVSAEDWQPQDIGF